MNYSQFNKLSLLEQVQAYISECEVNVEIEALEPAILSDIGEVGIVFDGHVVYLAYGKYKFGNNEEMGYHVWQEIYIPPTWNSPPDSNVTELLTTRKLEEAVKKVLETVIHERIGMMVERLGEGETNE